jgi:hypothetical protein
MDLSGTRLLSGGLAGLFVLALALPTTPAPGVDALSRNPVCTPSPMPLEGRASPYDSVSVELEGATVKICYGRPSARDRTMIGGEHVPFGQLWRTGANEPTIIHTTGAIRFAGIPLEAGSYAFYSIPGPDEWEFFVTRSTDHWGIRITDEVRAQEVGSATLQREQTPEHVETFTIRFGRVSGHSVPMILEWERFRVTVPIEMAHH